MEMNNEIRDEYYSRHVIYICWLYVYKSVFMTINFEISKLIFTSIRTIKTILLLHISFREGFKVRKTRPNAY